MNTKAEGKENYSNKIMIRMLGEFSISIGDCMISDSSSRTKQVVNLTQYLLAYRTKIISHDELVSILWPDGSSESPSNALKNLVYRARTSLARQGFPYAKEIIVFKHGCYSWNNEIPCEVDIEKFENLCKQAVNINLSDNKKIEMYKEAISLYKGDFLAGSCYEDWVIHLCQYYHSMYLKCVYEVIVLLEQKDRYDEVKTICENAILVDRLEEALYRHILYAMYKTGHTTSALAYYQKVSKLFYTELGVKLSEETRNVYELLLKSTQNDEKDLQEIKKGLIEEGSSEGAFLCEYEIFKSIYQHSVRDIKRSNEEIFIGLFTVTDNDGRIPSSKELNRVMAKFLDTIIHNLRSSDVVARYSLSQFVIMLPRISHQNANKAMERVVKRFNNSKQNLKVKVLLSAQPISE